MQRTLGTVFIAVLVVFAGCSGVLGGDSDGPVETLTPAPVPTDRPTPTPIPQLAPGLTGQGIENSYTLMTASESFYRNQSFTVQSNYTALAPNGSVVTTGATVIRVGPPDEGFHIVPENNDDYSGSEMNPDYTEWWSGGERVLLKQTYANGTTTYDRVRTDIGLFRSDLAHGRLPYLLRSSGSANTSVTERITRNGTTLYRIQGIGWSELWGNESFQLLVDSSGVIHEYWIGHRVPAEYPELSEKNISKVIIKRDFSKIGATDAPERPSWVDEALSQTTPIPEEPEGRYEETVNGTDTNETATKTTSE